MWWEILLLTPVWTSLIVVQRLVGRFSYSPLAGQLQLFGAWWEDSLTHLRLDILRRHSVPGREIPLLAPGWTSLVAVWRVVGRFSYSSQAGHLWSSFGTWWGDCYPPWAGHLWSSFGVWWGDSFTRPRLDISSCHPAHGREILLLARGWTSLVIVWHMVGKISYSPQAGHLWLLFGAWWRGSITHPRLDILHCRLVHGGEILLLTPAGNLWSSFSSW